MPQYEGMTTTMAVGWFGVLAGAYRGRQNERAMLCHAVKSPGAGGRTGKALCGYGAERLCDVPAEASEMQCPTCLARAEKLAR